LETNWGIVSTRYCTVYVLVEPTNPTIVLLVLRQDLIVLLRFFYFYLYLYYTLALYQGNFSIKTAPVTLKDALDKYDIERANTKFGFAKDQVKKSAEAPKATTTTTTTTTIQANNMAIKPTAFTNNNNNNNSRTVPLSVPQPRSNRPVHHHAVPASTHHQHHHQQQTSSNISTTTAATTAGHPHNENTAQNNQENNFVAPQADAYTHGTSTNHAPSQHRGKSGAARPAPSSAVVTTANRCAALAQQYSHPHNSTTMSNSSNQRVAVVSNQSLPSNSVTISHSHNHGLPALQTNHYNSKTSKVSPATSMPPPPFLVIPTQHSTVSMMPPPTPTDGLLNSSLFLGSSESHPARPTTSNGRTPTTTTTTTSSSSTSNKDHGRRISIGDGLPIQPVPLVTPTAPGASAVNKRPPLNSNIDPSQAKKPNVNPYYVR
jgi:hypothetical protein